MGRYVVRRLMWMVLVLFVVSAITFGLMHAVPGGPFDAEKALPPEIIANLNARYHLDESLPRQYLRYVYDILVPRFALLEKDPDGGYIIPTPSLVDDFLIRFHVGGVEFKWMNFGPSYASRSRTVNDVFKDQLPVSFQLGVMALTFALLLGVPLGILAALKQNTIWDYLGMSVAIFGVSVPVIVLGPILVWIFGVALKWLPPTGWGSQAAVCPWAVPQQPRPRILQVRHHAGDRPGAGQLGVHRPPDPRQPAAGGPRGLHPHRPGEGPDGAPGHHPPCAQELAHPGHHHPRAAVRRLGDRDLRYRADLRHSRAWASTSSPASPTATTR